MENRASIRDSLEGQVRVYVQFLLSALRFSAPSFLGKVYRVYKFHLSQISPNSFRKLMCFQLLSQALGLHPDIDVFHYMYCTISIGDWVTFYSR